ncbi:MAG: hypothetical protein M3Y42_04705 [Actinomycetota bacterium]|nr:hypothetical protein [Actinomycetota bacterium]MDQ2956247.1 hypothetical protein [Actinomycetota bacterium]
MSSKRGLAAGDVVVAVRNIDWGQFGDFVSAGTGGAVVQAAGSGTDDRWDVLFGDPLNERLVRGVASISMVLRDAWIPSQFPADTRKTSSTDHGRQAADSTEVLGEPSGVTPLAGPVASALPAELPPRRSRRSSSGQAAAAIAVVAICAIAVSVVLLYRRSAPTTQARPISHPAAVVSDSDPALTNSQAATGGFTLVTTAGSKATSSTSRAKIAAAMVRYTAPGGESILAGPGWTADASSGVPTIKDYVQPPGTDRLVSAYVRIGISNPHSLTSISLEAAGAIDFLRAQDPGVVVAAETFGQFLGFDSVDIEFTNFRNNVGHLRHAVERLWITDGVTRILKWDTPIDQWDPSLRAFQQLAATCAVS